MLIRNRCVAIGLDVLCILPKKWYPPTLLLSFGTDKNNESDEIYSIILDFSYVIDVLG